jgi:predicted regulator of Ras-like GTPase activity (Roadblock/LC7/MglB family)
MTMMEHERARDQAPSAKPVAAKATPARKRSAPAASAAPAAQAEAGEEPQPRRRRVASRPAVVVTQPSPRVYQEAVGAALSALRRKVPLVTGALVASCDGFLLACDLPEGVEPDGMAALTATELSLATRVVSTVAEGAFEEVVIRNSGAHIAIYAAGPRAALAVLAGPRVSLGRLHLEARPAARAIAAQLSALTERNL